MNILVCGSTTATHALVWKLFDSPRADQLVCAPGNGGTNSIFARGAELDATNENSLLDLVMSANIDLVVSNHELIAGGLGLGGDLGQIDVVGAGPEVAPLITSRFAFKDWVNRHNLPTVRGRTFARPQDAEKYAASQPLPIQISADDPQGLTVVCRQRGDIQAAVQACSGNRDGLPTRGIVVEEYVAGPVVSANWLTDGETMVKLPSVRIYSMDDQRANPAVGAHSSTSPLWQRLDQHLHNLVCTPIQQALQADNMKLRTWISAECVLAQSGPLLTRLDFTPPDQVAAVIMPRLRSDLVALLMAVAQGKLASEAELYWKAEHSAAVMIYSQSRIGQPIEGLDQMDGNALVFHHATWNNQGLRFGPPERVQVPLIARVGRNLQRSVSAEPSVLPAITATGSLIITVASAADSLASARAAVYQAVTKLRIESTTYRTDIAEREI